MTLIDLGYADAGAAPQRPPVDRRLTRRVAAALVVLLCLTTQANSVPPTPRGLRLLWSVIGAREGDVAVVGDAVLTVGGPELRTLSAYGLRDGRPRWSHEMPDPVPYIDAAPDSRVLLLPAGPGSVPAPGGSADFYTRTIALDAATGAELWRSPGSGNGWAVTGTALLEERDPGNAAVTRLRVVRLSDGATVWSRDTPGVQQWTLVGADPAHPDRVALIDGDGAVWVLRLADGTEAVSGDIAWDPGRPENGDHVTLYAHDDALYVLQTGPDRSAATAYSDRSLSQLWSVNQPSSGGGVYSCGAVLCLGGGSELVAYDWETGAVRWRVQDKEYAIAVGGGLLLTENRDPSARQVLLDVESGRELANLGKGRAPVSFDDSALLMLGSSESALGRTTVTQLDPRTGETFPLGTIEAVADAGCELTERLLLCHHAAGKITVTAVG